MIVLTVVGARPQFVKAAVVSSELRRHHREILLHTGQHYDDAMSDRFFRDLQMPEPDYQLGVGSAMHGQQTARMLVGIEEAIERERPDVALVYGDTNSTLAGALAAAKRGVKVAHVEAGLRSFNRRMPEEINRVMTDRVADLLFCPSETAVRNLTREGITSGVHLVGDVMAEALDRFAAEGTGSALATFGVEPGRYVLATVHRAENTDDPARLERIMNAFDRLADVVLLPAHPRVRQALARLGRQPADHVRIVDPVGYREMIELQRFARVVLTDSGGVQKEACWLSVPCVTLRDETEWIETIEAGWNVLVGADTDKIVHAVQTARPPDLHPALYHQSRPSAAIVGHLSSLS